MEDPRISSFNQNDNLFMSKNDINKLWKASIMYIWVSDPRVPVYVMLLLIEESSLVKELIACPKNWCWVQHLNSIGITNTLTPNSNTIVENSKKQFPWGKELYQN